MKVLFYIHNLGIGGAEKIVADSIIELQKSCQVVLVVNNLCNSFLEKKVKSKGVTIIPLEFNLPKNKLFRLICYGCNRLRNYRKIFNRIINKERPDVIHIHTLVTRLNGVNFPINRMVFTCHSEIQRYLTTNPTINRKLLKKMAGHGLSFFALSHEMFREIKRVFETNNVYLIPNAINVSEIRRNIYDRKSFLPSVGIHPNSFVIGSIGRFHKVKNHERIIEIFSALNKILPNSNLVLIGGDSDNRISEIKKMVERLNLSNNVLFLGVRDDATSIINCFDCFLLTSFSESFSISLVEAQALGIKCVASDNVPEDVVCNNCIRLSLDLPNDIWVSTILKEKGKEVKNISEFDIHNVSEKMISNYNKICQEKRITD